MDFGPEGRSRSYSCSHRGRQLKGRKREATLLQQQEAVAFKPFELAASWNLYAVGLVNVKSSSSSARSYHIPVQQAKCPTYQSNPKPDIPEALVAPLSLLMVPNKFKSTVVMVRITKISILIDNFFAIIYCRCSFAAGGCRFPGATLAREGSQFASSSSLHSISVLPIGP